MKRGQDLLTHLIVKPSLFGIVCKKYKLLPRGEKKYMVRSLQV